ncbi:MAG: hypothetical protein U9P71_02345 [Campylobacterota bacterium]|nr:hypothetical protein [Campylobacterota bacterium]
MKLLFLLTTITSLLFCAPAFHGKKNFALENGNTFSGYIKGDEHLNWIESDEGEVILFNKEHNRYEYATIKENKLIPSGVAKKAQTKQRKSATSISKEQLHDLWKKKRSDEFKRREQ